jgi:hypothetical protein
VVGDQDGAAGPGEGRRTATGVAAYFDLITDDARLFYGDNFHVGYFRSGSETLAEALDAHTVKGVKTPIRVDISPVFGSLLRPTSV